MGGVEAGDYGGGGGGRGLGLGSRPGEILGGRLVLGWRKLFSHWRRGLLLLDCMSGC